MKYSVYFEKVREIADTNPQLAESLLHEAESYASQVVLEHLGLCARGRKNDFHNLDNKIIGRLYIKNVFSQIRRFQIPFKRKRFFLGIKRNCRLNTSRFEL